MTSRPLAAAALAAGVLAAGAAGASAAPASAGGPVDLLTEADLRIDGAAAADSAGFSVAGAGDVDGDGVDDLVVGARLAAPSGRASAGSAYVILGASGLGDVDLADLGAHGFRIDGAAPEDFAGTSVAGAGDVDGDGYDDVLVGADGADPVARAGAGAAYVVFGGPAPSDVDLASPGSAAITIAGAASSGGLGGAAAGAGDVDGDGYDDVVVGAPGVLSGAGAAYVVRGSASPSGVDLASPGAAAFRIAGAGTGDNAGYAVGGGGDVDGDGRDDVVVGAPYASPSGRPAAGAAYVILGAPGMGDVSLASLGAQGFRIAGAAGGDEAGKSVAGAGDVDRDGLGDVVVGSPFADPHGRTSAGTAAVVRGSATPGDVDLASPGAAAIEVTGAVADGLAGWSVAGAGDMNGDGYDDVVTGAELAEANGRSTSGSAAVVFGGPAPVEADMADMGDAGFRIDGAEAGDNAGFSVSGAGDLDGDGRDAVLIGAIEASANGRALSGSAFVVDGFDRRISVTPADLPGFTAAAGGSQTRTLTIASTGSAGLTVGDVALSGPDADAFTLADTLACDGSAPARPGGSPSAAVVVPPGEGCTVAVTYAPAAAGVHAATVTITSDDPTAPAVARALAGTATGPGGGGGGGGGDTPAPSPAPAPPGAGEPAAGPSPAPGAGSTPVAPGPSPARPCDRRLRPGVREFCSRGAARAFAAERRRSPDRWLALGRRAVEVPAGIARLRDLRIAGFATRRQALRDAAARRRSGRVARVVPAGGVYAVISGRRDRPARG